MLGGTGREKINAIASSPHGRIRESTLRTRDPIEGGMGEFGSLDPRESSLSGCRANMTTHLEQSTFLQCQFHCGYRQNDWLKM